MGGAGSSSLPRAPLHRRGYGLGARLRCRRWFWPRHVGRIVHGGGAEAETVRTVRRQRRIAPRLDRIELARNEHHEVAWILDSAGDTRGLVTGAEINVGARRADD